jgi:hypothetical protein
MAGHGVFGTVSAVSGSTLTITSKGFGQSATTQTYTVDASSATVMKDNATSTLSAVAVGDTVMVAGTVSGTNVAATMIRDGMPKMMPGGMGGGPGMRGGHASSTPMNIPQGNGEPVIGGAVTAVSGSSITVTNKSNVTYTVDATSATVTKDNATSTLSAVAVGDNVIVQGTVNGNAVTASSVLDQGVSKTQSGSGPAKGGMGGILGGIGSFFHSLFGFF